MKALVLATENPGKKREFGQILIEHGVQVDLLSLQDFPSLGLPPEGSSSYRENAMVKAKWVASATGLPALADDSGLEVDALAGAPGPLSARLAGRNSRDVENVDALLEKMKGVPLSERSARFRCVLVLVDAGYCVFSEGVCEGEILPAPSGSGGFGYDPVFYYRPLGKTFAEMPEAEKNSVSHRARAIVALVEGIKSLLKGSISD